MVASDPAREPVLERAMPADAVPGSTIPEDTEAEVLLQDGTWAWAQVTGQRKDRHGRWCVGLRWYASPAVGGREGWYLYDPRLIRRPNGPLRLSGPGKRLARARVTRAEKIVAEIFRFSRAGRGLVGDRGRVLGSCAVDETATFPRCPRARTRRHRQRHAELARRKARDVDR